MLPSFLKLDAIIINISGIEYLWSFSKISEVIGKIADFQIYSYLKRIVLSIIHFCKYLL